MARRRNRVMATGIAGVVVMAFVAVVVWRGVVQRRPQDEDQFLKGVRQLREDTTIPSSEKGDLAPVSAVGAPMPDIELDTDEFEMGVVRNDGPTTKEMPIYNKGNGPLTIREVTSTCRCTEPILDEPDRIVPPHGQKDLKITLHPQIVHGFESTKIVTVSSNDPLKPMAKFKVHAQIDPEFEVVPERLDFGRVEKGADPELTMTVRQVSPQPFEVTGVEPLKNADTLDLSFEKRPQDQWRAPDRPEFLVKARLKTVYVAGNFDAGFYLVSTCKRLPKLMCSATGFVQSFFTVAPSPLPLYTMRPGQKNAGALNVTGDRPIEVTDVTVSGGDLVASAAPGPDPNTAMVSISVAPTAKPGRKEERLTFTVKAADTAATQTVRVYGVLINRAAKERTAGPWVPPDGIAAGPAPVAASPTQKAEPGPAQ